MALVAGQLYVFGGSGAAAVDAALHMLDLASMKWRSRAEADGRPPHPREGHLMHAVQGSPFGRA